MSQPLHPCPACQRHVFADACVCPFCAAKLPAGTCAKAAPPPGHRGMSRAARVAAGASLVGVAACFSTGAAYGAAYVEDAKADTPQDAGSDGVGGASSGEGGAGEGGSGEGGAAAGGAGGFTAAGGGAGHAAGGAGGQSTLPGTGGTIYGGPPGTGGGGPAPMYGASPTVPGKTSG